jgi:phosphotransacetylase
MVVVHPCDETSLRGAVDAAEAGIIKPILVGPVPKIANVARQFDLDIARYEVIDTPHSEAASARGVQLIHEGKGELLMKGSLHTDELMREVTSVKTGLRTARRISHVFIMDVPSHADTLFITDAAINIFPDLDAKRDIIQNAIDLYTQIGLGTPRVGILSAVETVTTKIPSTIDAAALCKMSDRGQISGGVLDGPLAFDNAIDPEAARIKGINVAWVDSRGGTLRNRPRAMCGEQHELEPVRDLIDTVFNRNACHSCLRRAAKYLERSTWQAGPRHQFTDGTLRIRTPSLLVRLFMRSRLGTANIPHAGC